MALDPFDLLGTWRLERWEVERADGSVGRPLGPRPDGLSIYGEDGWMSCHDDGRQPRAAVGRERAPCARGRARRGVQQLARLLLPLARRGRRRAAPREVAHNPAMVGTTQSRRASLRGRRAVVRPTGDLASGGMHRLWWRRVADAEG